MSTVIENIDSLFSVKSDIRQAIEDKGVDMTNTPFTSFAVKISEIPSGGGGDTDFEDGLITRSLSGAYTNARVSTIGSYTFYYCTSLTIVSFPKCTTIGNNAFYYCYNLYAASIPECTSIGNNAFYNCQYMISPSFPKCTTIGNNAFAFCYGLTTVTFPECTSIGDNAFSKCLTLTDANLPKLKVINSSVFQGCSELETVNIPSVSIINQYAFESCTSLKEISLLECKSIYNYAFRECSSLSILSAPKLEMTMVSVFALCGLTTVSLPKISQLGSSCFYGCHQLESIYVGTETSSVCYMGNSAVFNNTPMKNSSYLGYYGSIYVPMSLVDQYKTKTNWTYYADRIVGI